MSMSSQKGEEREDPDNLLLLLYVPLPLQQQQAAREFEKGSYLPGLDSTCESLRVRAIAACMVCRCGGVWHGCGMAMYGV